MDQQEALIMTLGEWDGLAPVAAAIALGVLAIMPGHHGSAGPGAAERLDALEQAPVGEGVAWSDKASGQQGMLLAAGIFRGADGAWCRRYQVTRQDDPQISSRIACRSADGGWRDRADRSAQAQQLAASP